MKRLATVSLLAFFCAVLGAAADDGENSIYGMQSLSISADTQRKHDLVLSHDGQPGFDFLRIPRSRGSSIELLVTADKVRSFKEFLQANDIEYQVISDDVSKQIRVELKQQMRARLRRRSGGDSSLNLRAFPRYDEIQAYIIELAKTHSDILKPISIGKSYEGRDIVGVKFTTDDKAFRPALLIDAGIHAREWIAPTTALYAIKQLAENASNRYIFENIDVYIIPVLNPDGYEYTHLDEKTRLWRKTRSDNPHTICKGADANRNFDIKWMSVGASDLPCSITYAGSRPFSEAESRALRDFILARRDRIKTYLSLHSHGQYLLHPWGFTSDLPKNEPVLRCAAINAASELYKIHGTRYQIGSSTNVLYPAAGGSDDWTMGVAGVDLAYTVELPGGVYGFAPPPSAIIPVGRETFEAIKVFARYVNGEICQGLV
ncbi:carboxypeptidase B [Nasonia vitripennis]|uniref:Peptidase M14 domain-containing protein n=1 Tax=Nasonia vitripennis TaxID=7425 RepID=A0A7M7G1U2_NASVI|nr:carboxypeptidase B [Nasonia vitripennis]